MSARPPMKLGEQHHKILDELLCNYTGKNLGELAERLGYTQSWLSTVINSDAFQVEYRRRREGITEAKDGIIVAKAQDVANKALDKLGQRIDSDDGSIDTAFYLSAATKVMQTLGYGREKAGAAASGQAVSMIPVEEEVITIARRRLVERAEGGNTIEATT